MQFSRDAASLIEQKSWDDLETRWMSEIESDPTRVEEFLEVAKLVRKADERQKADALLELLADALRERGAWPQRLTILREMGRLSKKPATLRAPLEEAVRKALGDSPSFQKVMAAVNFDEKDSNPIEKAEKIQSWLTYDVGQVFFMAGRGAGVVTELNPDLGICRVDFEKQKRVSIPLGAAVKNLTPLPPGHLLRDKFERPEALEKEVLASPADAFARMLRNFGRPLTVADVRDAMTGIVPEQKWASWWAAARKNPQIVVSGAGARATYSWNATEGGAETAIRKEFDQKNLRGKLELAKKHSGRNDEIASWFAQQLANAAGTIASSEPSLAWEILTVIEKLPGTFEGPFDRDELLLTPMSSRVIAGVSERTLRERALEIVRERHSDWPKVYAETFFLDDEPKILSIAMEALETEAPEIRDRLLDETLRHPRRHPRAFYWFCRAASENDELFERAGVNLIIQMLESIGWEEFSPIRARMKEMFDRGGLAVRILLRGDNEEQARKLVESLERFAGLEEYRRDMVRDAAHMGYPRLRAPEIEPIFATAEALELKREEYDRMKNVEIPATLKAIQVAREMGDLRENFEYKAARQRQEYLAARLTELAAELQRVRVIDPEEVDTSEVRIGTRVRLRNGDVHREVTILGPWESDPEHGVYSNQSEAAHALLGHRTEDIVSFMGNDYVVEAVDRWK